MSSAKDAACAMQLPVGTKGEAGSVEDKAVVATNLVHHGDGNAVVASDRGKHVAAKFALAAGEGRGRNIQQDLAACADQVFDRIDAVEAAVPEILVVPGIFANGERARSAIQVSERLAVGRERSCAFRRKRRRSAAVAWIGWRQSGRRASRAAEFKTCLPVCRLSGSDDAANHCDASGAAGDFFCGLAISFDEPRTIDQVARRIATDAQFREENKVDASALGSQGVVDDFGGISVKVPDRRVNLSERNPHLNSVTVRAVTRQMRR